MEGATLTKRTRDFVSESQSTAKKIVAAINAQPFIMTDGSSSVPTILDYGLAISEGIKVSSFETNGNITQTFSVNHQGVAEIVLKSASSGYDISRIRTAVSAFSRPLNNGVSSGDNVTLDRNGVFLSDFTNPRFREQDHSAAAHPVPGGMYDLDGEVQVGAAAQNIPTLTGTPVWGNWEITLVDHTSTTTGNVFGNDYIAGKEVGSSAVHPNCIVPRHSAETRNPVVPNVRYSIAASQQRRPVNRG